MKLHDNSAFTRRIIVPWPYGNLLKSEGIVEAPGGLIGLANFQKKCAAMPGENPVEERSAYAPGARRAVAGGVQIFVFVFRPSPCPQKTRHSIVAESYRAIVAEVIVRI